MSRRVRVHIDRLVLRGFDAGQRQAIALGLRTELARQLSQSLDGVDRGRSIAGLDAGRMSLRSDEPADRAGRRMAQRIVERIRR
jgi:hypothetical protein